MLKKIPIANRGDQPQSGAGAQLHRLMREVHAGDFTPMEKVYV
jgi:hypothetical protein